MQHLPGGPPGSGRPRMLIMRFHSVTTTDSVESINGGLAESPSEVPNPSSRSKLQVAVCSRADVSHGLFLRRAGPSGNCQRTHNAVFGVLDGLLSSHTHLYRAVRLSHKRVGQSITSIRAHGPE